MVGFAIHNPFASHRRLPLAPHAARTRTVARPDHSAAATLRAVARPAPFHPAAPLRLPPPVPPRLLLEALLVLLPCAGARDSGSSVPRPDATAASQTSSGSSRRSARRFPPASRTAGEFHYNLAGP